MGLKDVPRNVPRPQPERRVAASASRSAAAIPPHLVETLRWGASNDGSLGGLPSQTATDLKRLGLAESHPARLSHLGRPGSSGYGALHRSLRMTAKGFEAAGLPHRAGRLWFVFRGETHVPGRGILLLVKGGRLQTSLCELVAARQPPTQYDRKGIPIPTPARIQDKTEFESYVSPEEALEAVDRLVGRAEALSRAEGLMLDPGYLCWDGTSVRIEGMGPEGDAFVPLSVEEALARMREAFSPPAPGMR